MNNWKNKDYSGIKEYKRRTFFDKLIYQPFHITCHLNEKAFNWKKSLW